MINKHDNIELEARELIEALGTDIIKAYKRLVTMAEKYNADLEIQTNTIILGSEISDNLVENGGMSLQDDAKKDFFDRSVLIVEAIIRNYNKNELLGLNIDKVRAAFIEKGRPITVYKSEEITRCQGQFTLHPISFELRLGEITSVVGENGNGKSTLLKIIAGESAINSGRHSFPIFSPQTLDWINIKQSIAYIPQDLQEMSLFGSRKNYIHFTAGAKGIIGKENQEMVDYVIARLGLKKYQDYPWSKLSGGYKLRFELARQLVWKPKLLIMDEPLAHLDIKTQRLFLDDLRNLTNSLKYPLSVILSSQNLYEIESVSDHIIFLSDGRTIYNGPVQNISLTTGLNCFLLSTSSNIGEIKSAISPLIDQIKEITLNRDEVMLLTSPLLNGNTILNSLLEANIEIKYFRNISNSSRIFFEHGDK